MKIMVISTTVMVHPPVGYSGLEMLSSQLSTGLLAKGHQVTLVAPWTSKTDCELHPTTLGESEQLAYSGYRHKLPGYDCAIDMGWQKWAYTMRMEGQLHIPILGVCHAPINTMYNTPPPVDKPCFVGISQDQTDSIKEHLKVDCRLAYNGVDPNNYKPTNQKRNDKYLFLGRFSSIKSPDVAADLAIKCNVGLDMIGDDTITGEPELVKSVKDRCGKYPHLLKYIGPQTREQCAGWFNSNKCLLHLINRFREPFGLVVIESALCGCPTIAWRNGSMPELIQHGKTGFLVSSIEEAEDLIKNDAVSSIKSEDCIEWGKQFSVERMVDRYEQLVIEAMNGGW